MDKNAIKKYAVWARTELITRVSQRAQKYDITAEADANASSVNGALLSDAEIKQRKALIEQVKQKGFDQVMEEVAYTWFNRFIALRFMEVNGYLPSHIRVFTDDNNNFKPQILAEAIHLELDGLDMDKVYEMKNNNENDELYKYLIITQCNDLSRVLPGLFQKIADYTELLFPDNILREGSVIDQMISIIPEENWNVHTVSEDGAEQGQVQIIGWLYQYYNLEPNEIVYDGNMSKNRVPKELLPAATTIYTPDWAVHYMVENSLGKLWLENHPNNGLKSVWKYYLPEAEQSMDSSKKISQLIDDGVNPEDIKCLDPCSGSGHICVYLFDVLVQIYEAYGYTAREAASLIVKKNLYGLDIDDRAAQLASFSVTMKALQYDRRFLTRGIYPNVFSIRESNNIDQFLIDYFCGDSTDIKNNFISLVNEMRDAKEYGSIIRTREIDFDLLYRRLDEAENDISMFSERVKTEIRPFIESASVLHQKYKVVITNPPYLGSSRFSSKLDLYAKEYYKDEKSDLSMIMFRKALDEFVEEGGFVSFITTSSWMFLSSFEKVRKHLLKNNAVTSIVDFGTELFEGKVGHNPIVSWVCRKVHINYNLTAVRLVDYCYSRRDEKKEEFFNQRNHYHIAQSDFNKIPGSPLAYWLSENSIDMFSSGNLLSDRADLRQGLITGDNERFIRFWMECSVDKITTDINNPKKWFFYHKGGDYRKWYGNITLVVNWENDGYEITNFKDDKGKLRSRPQNVRYYLREGFTWTALTMADFNVRYMPSGGIFDAKGSSGFVHNQEDLMYLIGLCNSKVAMVYMSFLAPTMDYSAGSVGKLPVIINNSYVNDISEKVKKCIEIAKLDWDCNETSWDFKQHYLVVNTDSIEDAYRLWEEECNSRFKQLKNLEESINESFIEIYGMQNELTSEVNDKDISVRKANMAQDIRSFISYAVGCIMGRYSLDEKGLIYAGGIYDESKYTKYKADKDGIVPICDDEYFEDDIVNLFVNFVEAVYGKDKLEDNLLFIATALGGEGNSRTVIRNYFINDFYKDHCSMYSVIASGKRPIYWMFESGKKNGFKCLVYMHRYQADTIARIRTDYVHEQQSRYRTAIAETENRLLSASGSDKVKLDKKLKHLKEQDAEIHTYEEKIHHLADQMISINIDDGVKVNYAKFQDVLAKIK